jgi:phosphoribosylformylglycinamidine cyclo-ligase
MNLDDLLCVGARGPFALSNTIGRNARRVPGAAIAEIIHGYDALAGQFRGWGVEIVPTGGETADVGDLVGTLIVDATLAARLRRSDVVANDRVRAGDVIIALASFGQATYESRYNAGIGSNGLTSARHDLLHRDYALKYPETFDPDLPESLRYGGPFHVSDPLEGTGVTIGEALLSPTRTFAPILVPLLEGHRARISALVHCTGGGQTKCLRAGEGIHYVKTDLFPPPPLFRAIRRVSQASWRELYQVLNMGHRLEIIGPEELVPVVEELASRVGVETRVIGHCESSPLGARNLLTLTTPGGVERYEG